MAGTVAGAEKHKARAAGTTVEDYRKHVLAGKRFCYRCRRWQNETEFHRTPWRRDGRHATCRTCLAVRKGSKRPFRWERVEMRKRGLAWCRSCLSWQPLSQGPRGLCRPCANTYFRNAYLSNEDVRARCRQRTHARKRGVLPIPLSLQRELMRLYGGRCAYCADSATTWDHVVPVKNGGGLDGNIVPACATCNASKKAENVHTWLARTGRTPHPTFLLQHPT